MKAALPLFLFAATAAGAGCLVDIPLTDRVCAGDDDCLSGYACVVGTCDERIDCATAADCPDSRACGDGACRAGLDGGGDPVDGGRVDSGPSVDGGLPDDGGPSTDAGPVDAGPAFDAGPICHGAPVEVCAPAARVRRVCDFPIDDCVPALDFTSANNAYNSLVNGNVSPGYLFVYGGRHALEVEVFGTDALVIVGEAGASLYAGGGGHAIDVGGTGHVTVRSIEVSGDTDGDGDRDNDTYPMRAQESGTLIVEDCQVGPSQRLGIEVEDSARLELRRSYIFDNDNGGVDIIDSATAILENSLFFDNGNGGGAGSSLGNVRLDGPAGTALFRHNTVLSGNRKRSDETGGVICGAQQDLYASIIRSNTGNEISSAGCVLHASNVEGSGDDAGVIDADPLFDADYRLMAGSPCIDAASLNTDVDFPGEPSPTLDFDYEPRPVGGGYDIGHDEAQ